MATRLKTVHYSFPVLASLTNNTLTSLSQITVYLPETGTKTFRKVVAHVTCNDVITVTGGTLTIRSMSLSLAGAGYTTVSNTNTAAHSGENGSHWFSQDFTSHFTTNWSGTSRTCDFQLQINQSTGTTLGMVNVCVTLEITYEYDDTNTTQIKTVMIPLDANTGAMVSGSTTTYDTIPALDTYLPEASKTYRNIHAVVMMNTSQGNNTTSSYFTAIVGSAAEQTTAYEGALASDRFVRYVYDLTATYPDKSTTQNWRFTAEQASRFYHPQAYLVVTYEYNASTTTSVMNSVLLPMELVSPMGGTTSSDYQRGTRELWIQEPGTIATNRIAFFPYWTQVNTIAGLNMRIGTGSFVSYDDNASILCGTNCAMVRNDSAATLAKGRNQLNFDVYRSDTADFGWNISGFWLVNYTSDKHADGTGAHNHTVFWNLRGTGTAAGGSASWDVAATAPVIPESEYFITALGTRTILPVYSNAPPASLTLLVERLSGEGGIQWESAYLDASQSDPEAGTIIAYSQIRNLFNRWAGDDADDRMDLETARRWRFLAPTDTALSVSWPTIDLLITYHTIDYAIAGNITDSSGGTVNIAAHRADSGEKIAETSRSGNGAYSMVWYDDTEDVFVEARESSSLLGRSDDGKAA